MKNLDCNQIMIVINLEIIGGEDKNKKIISILLDKKITYKFLKIFFFDNIIKSNKKKVKIFLKIKLHGKCILCNFLKALSSKIVIIYIYI